MARASIFDTGTVFASGARTATSSSADIANPCFKGVRVCINVTASAATPSVTFAIEEKDPVSAAYTALLTSAAITGASHTDMRIYPTLTAAANTKANDIMPATWRVTATHVDADSITYSVSYTYIP